jgi:hypothetical protein
MKLWTTAFVVLAALSAGCSSGAIAPPQIGTQTGDVYPTSRKQFGAKLKPSLLYTNADIQGAGCAWGIAIH